MNSYSEGVILKYPILYKKSKRVKESPSKNLITPLEIYIFFFGDFELQCNVPNRDLMSGYEERGYELANIKSNCVKYKI